MNEMMSIIENHNLQFDPTKGSLMERAATAAAELASPYQVSGMCRRRFEEGNEKVVFAVVRTVRKADHATQTTGIYANKIGHDLYADDLGNDLRHEDDTEITTVVLAVSPNELNHMMEAFEAATDTKTAIVMAAAALVVGQ